MNPGSAAVLKPKDPTDENVVAAGLTRDRATG